MKALIVFAIATLVTATTVQEEAYVIAKLDQLESTDFGRYILDTLLLEMSTHTDTSDSLDHLIRTLEKLETRYQDDQKEDDANNRQFQAECDADIAAYDTDIANSNYQRITLEAKLEGDLLPNRAIHQGVEKAKAQEVSHYEAEIKELDSEREEQAAVYEQKMSEHREASRIIRQAQAIIKDNLVQPSLLEVKKNKHASVKIASNVLVQLSEDLSRSIKRIKENHKFTKGYASVFKVLLTIMNKSESTADQGSVQKIIQLCSDLLSKIDQSSDLERFAEDKRVEAYNKHRGLLMRDFNSASNILANTRAIIESYTNQITQVENSITNIEQRLENLNDMRSERYTECEQDAFDYAQKRTARQERVQLNRDQSRQLVSDVIGLVNQHARALREQLALRIAAGDNI